MEVGVHLSGNNRLPGIETTFTQNVSSRGACVITSRRWRTGDRVRIASLAGDFRAIARVAYCQNVRGDGYLIGVEFLEPAGNWVVPPADSTVRVNR
jgi:hypothetical protein